MPATAITIDNAKQDKLFYVVANVVIFREADNRCLILKRDEREKVHPGKYGVVGGKLEWHDLPIDKPTRINGDVLDYEDALEDLLQRETFEEAGIKIERDLKYLNSVAYIRPDGIPSVLIKFAVKYRSGDVVLEKGSFTDYQWVNEHEVKNFSCLEGIAEEVAKTIKFFYKTARTKNA